MGRIRIKKKDEFLAFRETAAYRFILAALSFLVCVTASILSIRAFQLGNTASTAIAALVALGTISFAVYNLNRMRSAKVPRRTAQRMRRRR